MKKSLILFLTLIFLTPSLVFSGVFTFKAGLFIPRAKSDLWKTEFENMSFNKTNYQTTNFGFSYEYFLTREMSLAISVDSYTKNKSGNYKDYVGISFVDGDFAFPNDYEGEFIPYHSFNVSITPIQVSLKLTPMGRRGKLIPYLGGGAGLYLWSVRIYGDLIDFSDEWLYYDPDLDADISVFPIELVDAREDNRITIGYHAFVGIMFPVARRITFEAEFKYNIVKGNFRTDPERIAFEGFERFDLSGYQISLGLNYWF